MDPSAPGRISSVRLRFHGTLLLRETSVVLCCRSNAPSMAHASGTPFESRSPHHVRCPAVSTCRQRLCVSRPPVPRERLDLGRLIATNLQRTAPGPEGLGAVAL